MGDPQIVPGTSTSISTQGNYQEAPNPEDLRVGTVVAGVTGTAIITQAADTSTFDSMLIMTCNIERDTGEELDESNKKIEDWNIVEEGIACLFEPYFGREAQDQEILTAKTVVDKVNFMFQGDVVLTTKDRITNIVLTLDNSSVDEGPLYIHATAIGYDPVGGGIHHREAILKREQGS